MQMIPKKTEKIIFDFDGTLLDTSKGVYDTLRAVFGEFGISCSEEKIRSFIGPPLFECLKQAFGFSDAVTMDMVSAYRRQYLTTGLLGYDGYPGVPQLLRRLKLSGARLFVATNKPTETAKKMLELSGLLDFFEGIYGAGMNDVKSIKAENIRNIASDNSDNSKDAIMVGDRESDVSAAHEAGIPCIYVGYGFGSKAEADDCGADYFAGDIKELARLLGVAGLFITYEGGDGAGKTTQINMLVEYLEKRGERVVKTFEPGGCGISQKIRELLLDKANSDMHSVTEALLYAAARAQHVRQVIRPELESGAVVISDRYVDSSVAYQGYGRMLGEEFVWEVNKRAVCGVMPQRTYFIHANPKQLADRRKGNPDRIESEGDDFKERVEDGFFMVKEANAQRVMVLDATCPSRDIFAIIKDDVDRLLF